MLEAQKAGKVRFIGFTGHKSPDIHLKMLATASKHGFKFDAVQMPLNVMDAHFNSFEKKVLPVLTENGIGVLGMKPMGDHIILESKTVTPTECLHYSMNLPTSVVITGLRFAADPSASARTLPALFSRWTLPRSRLFLQKPQRRRRLASSNFTRPLTSLTARTPIHSGLAKGRRSPNFYRLGPISLLVVVCIGNGSVVWIRLSKNISGDARSS